MKGLIPVMKNAVNRDIPEYINGKKVKLFQGAFATQPDMHRQAPIVKCAKPGESKLMDSLEDVFRKIPIRDGMTLGFHHHFRNGDGVLNQVLEVASRMGIKDLTIAASAIFSVHAPLLQHIKDGVVTHIDTNYAVGPVAKAISQGLLENPVIFRTHGGRARAIECGDLHIDVAFIAAPAADEYGNLNGIKGETACGSLGYAFPDAEYADVVVAVTDHIEPYPLAPIAISQERVDYVVKIDYIGDPEGIVSGTTKITKDPVQLKIASYAAKVIEASGVLKDGFSFQTGAGGASLAVAHYLSKIMKEKNIKGSFVMGGITEYLVKMYEEGLFKCIMDVQDFDLDAVRSLKENEGHLDVGAGLYASPYNSGCIVNKLDCAVLGATEIDKQFNVNVITGSDGVIMGGSGGHSDAAAGASLTIITTNLVRSRLAVLKDRVQTITTPGESIDVLVTEYGVAVNPKREDLIDEFKNSGIPVMSIDEMAALAEQICGKAMPVDTEDQVIGVVEYRDGTVIDVIRKVKSK